MPASRRVPRGLTISAMSSSLRSPLTGIAASNDAAAFQTSVADASHKRRRVSGGKKAVQKLKTPTRLSRRRDVDGENDSVRRSLR